MVFLTVEILCVLILVITLAMLIIDESKTRARDTRPVRLKGYWDGGNDRRSTERLNIVLEVKYRVNGKFANVKSVDISRKGIKLLLDEKIEKGTPLKIDIKLPDRDHFLKSYGEVAWSEEAAEDEKASVKRLFNTGIKFSKFHEQDEERLLDFIQRHQT